VDYRVFSPKHLNAAISLQYTAIFSIVCTDVSGRHSSFTGYPRSRDLRY
jgi:hypothetical protein